jgi:sugar (pentulose or hexulose) kinase
VPKLVGFKQIYTPKAESRALYDERFEVFKQIYSQMKGIYHRLNG